MKTTYGSKVTVVGKIMLAHKRTGKTKYFLVTIDPWNVTGKVYVTLTTSAVRGMTQAKAKQLPSISESVVRIDYCTESNGYV